MRIELILILLTVFVIFISGCTNPGITDSESKALEEGRLNLSPADNNNQTPPTPSTGPQAPAADPCRDVVCADSEMSCPDGSTARCSNTCSEGRCSSCTPECPKSAAPANKTAATAGSGSGGSGSGSSGSSGGSGSSSPPTPPGPPCTENWQCGAWGACINSIQTRTCHDNNNCGAQDKIETRVCCSLQCGACQTLNEQACACEDTVPCCGNNACEQGENYSACSSDCLNCDDGNVCTLDTYNYNTQQCEHSQTPTCCGNGVCEQGENSSCSQDCPAEQGLNRVVYSEVYYDTPGDDSKEEFIELYNPTDSDIVLNNYAFMDLSGRKWSIPNGTIMKTKSFLTIARDSAGFSALFNCQPDISDLTIALNNDGDVLFFFQEPSAQNADMIAYEGQFNWNITASTGKSLQRKLNETLKTEADNWLSEQTPNPHCKE